MSSFMNQRIIKSALQRARAPPVLMDGTLEEARPSYESAGARAAFSTLFARWSSLAGRVGSSVLCWRRSVGRPAS